MIVNADTDSTIAVASDSATAPTAPAAASVDTEILTRYYPELNQYLNLPVILPHLSKHGLLPPDQLEEFATVSPLPVPRDKINKLLATLSRNDPGYLREFIQCLRESAEEAGDGHTELADSLEGALNQPQGTWRDHFHPWIKKGHSKLKKYCPTPCICCYAVMAALFVIALLSLIIVSQVPAAEDTIRPQHAFCNDTVELQFNLDNQWLDSATISINEPCAARLYFIHGLSCRDLPTIHVVCNGTNPGPSRNFVYMLPGSAIHFTIPENADTPVWIFTDFDDATRYSSSPRSYNCQQHSSDSFCFEARLHRPVYIYNVSRPAYYFLRWDPEDGSGINFFYEKILYDFEQISAQYENTVSVVPYILDFGPDFNFEQSCVLLHIDTGDLLFFPCACNYGRVHVSDVERRQDVLLFPALLLFIWLLTLVIYIVVHCVYVWWDNKNSTRSV